MNKPIPNEQREKYEIYKQVYILKDHFSFRIMDIANHLKISESTVEYALKLRRKQGLAPESELRKKKGSPLPDSLPQTTRSPTEK